MYKRCGDSNGQQCFLQFILIFFLGLRIRTARLVHLHRPVQDLYNTIPYRPTSFRSVQFTRVTVGQTPISMVVGISVGSGVTVYKHRGRASKLNNLVIYLDEDGQPC